MTPLQAIWVGLSPFAAFAVALLGLGLLAMHRIPPRASAGNGFGFWWETGSRARQALLLPIRSS